MASRDDFVRVAKEIISYLNKNGLGFKTYHRDELDGMIKAVAGDGARVSSASNFENFESALLERGLMCFPSFADSEDGFVRIFRTGTIAANILQAFRYPGPTGDAELAALLRALRSRRQGAASDDASEG